MENFLKKIISILVLGLILNLNDCVNRSTATSTMLDDYKEAKTPVMVDNCEEAYLSNWKKINANGEFVFMIPNNLKDQDVQGIDSYVGEYKSSKMIVSFDYGEYSELDTGFYSKYPNHKEINLNVNGNVGKLITYEYSLSDLLEKSRLNKELGTYKYNATIYIDRSVARGRYVKNGLKMCVRYKEKKDLDIAKKVFCSIKFP